MEPLSQQKKKKNQDITETLGCSTQRECKNPIAEDNANIIHCTGIYLENSRLVNNVHGNWKSSREEI